MDNFKKYILPVIIWVIVFFVCLDVGTTLLSEPNTILNIFGFVLLCLLVYFSIITRCFTKKPKKGE